MVSPTPPLRVLGARQNNLTGFDLDIPHDRFVVVTGVSGSGKSSLAFDTVYAEGQWRFLESLPSYTRLLMEKVSRPRVEGLENVRPAIALEQHNAVRTARSTVGTATELYDLFRVLFAAHGEWLCPRCELPVVSWTPETAARLCREQLSGERVTVEVTATDLPLDGPDHWARQLSARGYARVRIRGAVHRLDDPELSPILPEDTRVVLDRVEIGEDHSGRLHQALSEGFRVGSRQLFVQPPAGEALRFPLQRRCRGCGAEAPPLRPLLFSFNHPLGACPTCNGFGALLEGDENKVIPDPTRSLAGGAVEPWQTPANRWWQKQLEQLAGREEIPLEVPWADLPEAARRKVWDGSGELEGVRDFLQYLEGKRYKMHVRVFLARYRSPHTCPACAGRRLRPEVLQVQVDGRSVADAANADLGTLARWIRELGGRRPDAREVLWRIESRLDTLLRLGLHYLTMDRATRSLSGGEAQRAALALQLQNHLAGALYVLDEPTVGLHPRDVEMLTGVLQELVCRGNTVLAVEHDLELIRRSEHCIEMGPGGGAEGGRVLFSGPPEELARAATPTGRRLADGSVQAGTRSPPRAPRSHLLLSGCHVHNLRDLNVSFPLGTLTCVTGVSGSGKSSLVVDTLQPAVASRGKRAPCRSVEIHGTEEPEAFPRAVHVVDQSPMGRTPRSIPLTYVGVYTAVRDCFAGEPASRRLGLEARHFSFNVKGGRCERCQGTGFEKLEMLFFEDLYVACEVCAGRRFQPQVLTVRFRGKSIDQVLGMTVDEGRELFAGVSKVERALGRLHQMGLGYLVLGQPAPTLSGGEAQRLKIVSELLGRTPRGQLYLLDEPTTGLHADDVDRLLGVLQELVDAGNTVVAVEHHPDFIAATDWVIDLGPEGGAGGGRLVDCGPPPEIARRGLGPTGRYLARRLG